MKGLAAAALAVAIAFPACAQRSGSGHASFGGHSAPAARPSPGFSGFAAAPSRGFTSSAPMRYSGYSGAAYAHAPVSYPSSMRLIAPGVRHPVTAPITRPTFYHPPHGVTITHNFYIHTYPLYPYAYAYPSYVYGYLPADLVDDSYDNFTTQTPPDYSSAYPQPMPQPDDGYPQPMPQPENGYPQPVPQPDYGSAYPQPAPEMAYPQPSAPPGYQGYPPQSMPASPQMQYVPGSASTVTLIYRDGRPPEQIQNYLATRSTLTVLDGGRRREVPLSDLDIPATISANRQTGVDFQLPTR